MTIFFFHAGPCFVRQVELSVARNPLCSSLCHQWFSCCFSLSKPPYCVSYYSKLLRATSILCVCVRTCTVDAKWSLYLPLTLSLSVSVLRCLSVLFCPLIIKATLLLPPTMPFFLPLPLLPLHKQPLFPNYPSLPSPPRYLSLTHYPTAWSNQSAICEWKLSPHTVSLFYMESALP